MQCVNSSVSIILLTLSHTNCSDHSLDNIQPLHHKVKWPQYDTTKIHGLYSDKVARMGTLSSFYKIGELSQQYKIDQVHKKLI